ncbi:MAG TPA: iron-containing alcohol dehydrogenase [Acidimicrobiales bacterium]|nr:iron-containing alcohol dehydrogenase [Acidimicrobiales bacterium]
MPGASGAAAQASSGDVLPSALEIPVLSVEPLGAVHLVASTTTSPRITFSTSTDDEEEAAEELAGWLRLNGAERPFLIASRHGRRLVSKITQATGTDVPGRHATQGWARSCSGRARDADAVVAIGGGRCLDLAKLVAAGAGIPFIAVPTQLSHDGVCSPVSVLPRTVGGLAESLEAVAPHVAFFSLPTLIRSPITSLRAGIGDLLANPLALHDWKLASDAGLEQIHHDAWHLSAESFRLIEPVLEEPLVPGSVGPGLIGLLAHALVTSGFAMLRMGTSRPVSGAEHKISHAIDELFGGRAHHGAQVAFASLVSVALHGLDVESFRRCLVNLGLPHHPRQLGLSEHDMVDVLLRAPHTRPGRFTILESAALDAPAAGAVVRSLWPGV